MTIMLLTTVTGGGVYIYYAWNNSLKESARERSEITLKLLHKDITAYIINWRKPVKTLSRMPAIRKVLLNNTAKNLSLANHILDIYCTTLKSLTCYLMDNEGLTIASSNRHAKKSFIGKNYSFRPYFKHAISGESFVYLALGADSKKRGVYFSHPIIVDSKPIGVVVVKVSVAYLEQKFSRIEGITVLTGPNEIVFASSRKDWLFKSLWPLPKNLANQLLSSRQFGDKLPSTVGLKRSAHGEIIDKENNFYIMKKTRLRSIPGWSITHFQDTKLVIAHRDDSLNRKIGYGVGFLLLIIAAISMLLYIIARREITTRKRTELQLAENEKKYHSLFELSSDANMTLDEKGFIDCNQATLLLFGCANKEDFIGKHPGEFSSPTQADGTDSNIAADQHIQEACQHGTCFFEWTHRRLNGDDFPAEVQLSSIDMGDRNILQAIVRDITVRKHKELQLIHATEDAVQANAAKSEFLSSMSHELRTPMNAILGFAQMLKLDADMNISKLSEIQQENVDEILHAGHHLLSLINDVLDLSSIESGKQEIVIEPIDLEDVLQHCISLIGSLAKKQNLKIIDNVSKQSKVVKSNFTRLKQILLNLLSNAVKYNSENGSITINSEPIEKNRIRISIIDTGPGLTEAQMNKLFIPFERLSAKYTIEGTGIGLTISKHLVELMDGAIGVESSLGEGSTFWIELPEQ